MDKIRAEFEKWAVLRRDKYNLPHFVIRKDDGSYVCSMTENSWEAWQAAHALYTTTETQGKHE